MSDNRYYAPASHGRVDELEALIKELKSALDEHRVRLEVLEGRTL